MNRNLEVVEEAALRILVVAGAAVAFGYFIYGPGVFDVRMTWFEFVANGVTIGTAYMTFKLDKVKNGFLVLFFWYLFLIAFIYVPHNYWMPIQAASYVVGLTAAIYVFFYLAGKHLVNGWVQRILSVVLLIGFAHGMIILFLELITLRVFAHPLKTFDWSFMNLKSGVVIGLLCAIGMELSERIIHSGLLNRSFINERFQCSSCGGELRKGDSVCRSCGGTVEWPTEIESAPGHE